MKFADISKVFTNIIKVIYSDIKIKLLLFQYHFPSCQLILLIFSKFPGFSWKNADVCEI